MTEFSDRDIALMPNWTELRESKGISLDDILQRTNIHLSKLKAIEAHEFESLGTETFALGYIRLYAKALDEDSDVFVQVYKDAMTSDLSGNDGAVKPWVNAAVQNAGPSALLTAVRKINVLYLSVAVIIIWIVAMTVLPRDAEKNTAKEPAPAAVVDDVTSEGHTDLPVEQAPIESEPSVERINPEASIVDDADNAAPAQTEPQTQVQTQTQQKESSSTFVAPSSDSEAPAEQSTTGTGDDLLVLSFSDDCWLEISDATGRVLIAELQEKGDNQRVFGQAPFKVMLGNARVVTLTLNGEVVSIVPTPGRKTLRFTVPR